MFLSLAVAMSARYWPMSAGRLSVSEARRLFAGDEDVTAVAQNEQRLHHRVDTDRPFGPAFVGSSRVRELDDTPSAKLKMTLAQASYYSGLTGKSIE
jgi:hypothetical protein